jgi:glycosyltransferase involved in cell wall biosynthesis
MKITAIILAHNEEKNIVDCIDSLLFCDEILIIDDNSTDRTLELVEKLKHPNIKIITRSFEDFSEQRNFAQSQASNAWILYVDADERVSKKLCNEIKNLDLEKTEMDGFSIRRQDHMWGKALLYGETGNIRLLRLGRKNAGKWSGRVHEIWKVSRVSHTLAEPLDHFPHPAIKEFITEINKYSTIRAAELYDAKVSTNRLHITAYPVAKFFKNYFCLQGFRDGTAGFVHAVLMSLHSFLVRGKLYLLWKGIKNS